MLARRLDWVALLERLFGPDATLAHGCIGALAAFAFITVPDVTARILAHLGLPAACRRRAG